MHFFVPVYKVNNFFIKLLICKESEEDEESELFVIRSNSQTQTEDSLTGIKAGKAANMEVAVVPSIEGESDEFSIVDHVMHSLLDLQPELCGLPPFDDCMFLYQICHHPVFLDNETA